MTKVDAYRETLRTLADWDSFLLRESGLPGPRGNLELAWAVADEGSESLFRRFLTYDAEKAPTNSPHEFLAMCGVIGLGKLLAAGDGDALETLRSHASDPRGNMIASNRVFLSTKPTERPVYKGKCEA